MKRQLKFMFSPMAIGATVIILLGLICTKDAVDCNDATRMSTIHCLIDYNTFSIDRSCIPIPFDKIVISGNTFSDKPLLLPTLAAAVYLPMSWCGITFLTQYHLTIYLINLLCINLLNLIIYILVYRRLARERSPAVAALGAGSLILCSLIFSYSTVFNNHTPAALLALLFYLTEENFSSHPSLRLLFRAGLLGGLLWGAEYIFGTVFLITGAVFAMIRPETRRKIFRGLYIYTLGAMLPISASLLINYLAYGSVVPQYMGPLESRGTFAVDPLMLAGNKFIYVCNALFGSRGILLFTPTLLLVLYPLRRYIRRPDRRRVEWLFLIAIAAVLTVYLTITNDFGGWAYGFRYFIPATPILWLLIFLTAPLERRDVGIILATTLVWGLAISLIGSYNCWTPCRDGAPANRDRLENTIIGNLQCILYEYGDRRAAQWLMRQTSGYRRGYEYLADTFKIRNRHRLGREALAEARRMPPDQFR